ncbi:hypothetical protein BJX99DRAFT_225848 [Aspergillus californicus]
MSRRTALKMYTSQKRQGSTPGHKAEVRVGVLGICYINLFIMPISSVKATDKSAFSCDQCRKRKVKCGGEQPNYTRCISRQDTCLYKLGPTYRKGGKQSQGT